MFRNGVGEGTVASKYILRLYSSQEAVLCTAVVLPSVRMNTNYDPKIIDYMYLCSWR